MFTLTIYFFVLNVNVEFVLIYRPHPVSTYFKYIFHEKVPFFVDRHWFCCLDLDPDSHWDNKRDPEPIHNTALTANNGSFDSIFAVT